MTSVTERRASTSTATGRIRVVAIAAGFALALWAALPAVAEARIVPGKSVAGVALGDSAAKVRSVLGKPEAGSNFLNYRYVRRHGLGVYFIAGKVFEITVVRGRRATAKGIRIGSTRSALNAAYRGVRCRAAAAGARTVECRLPARFKRRASETLFTLKRDRVTRIAVHFV